MRQRHLLLFLLLALWSNPVLGQGFREAEMEFSRGKLLYEMRDYSRAAESLGKAWSIVPDNKYLPLLALSHQALGNSEKALVFGEMYLERLSGEPDPDVASMVGELRDTFARGKARFVVDVVPTGGMLKLLPEGGKPSEEVVTTTPHIRYLPEGDWSIEYAKVGFQAQKQKVSLGSGEPVAVRVELAREKGKAEVRIVANVEGARVRMDGVEVGTVPFKALVEGGDHLFQVWAPDHIEWTGVVDAVPGKVVDVAANLAKAQGRVPEFPRYDLTVEGGGGPSMSVFGWVIMGLGVAGGGVAGYFFYDMYATNDELVLLPEGDPGIPALEQKVYDNWLYGMISGGAAGALVLGGLLMVLLDDGDEDEPAAIELLTMQPLGIPGGFGVDASWVF